jgi:hypothetical protein
VSLARGTGKFSFERSGTRVILVEVHHKQILGKDEDIKVILSVHALRDQSVVVESRVEEDELDRCILPRN